MSAVRHHTVPYFDRFADAVPDFPAAPWWWGCTCGAAVGPFGTEDMARAAGKAHERDMARETAEAELDALEDIARDAEIDAMVTIAEAELREDDRRYLTGIGDAITAAEQYEPLDRDAVRAAALGVDPEVFAERMGRLLDHLTQPSGPCKPRVCRPRRATR